MKIDPLHGRRRDEDFFGDGILTSSSDPESKNEEKMYIDFYSAIQSLSLPFGPDKEEEEGLEKLWMKCIIKPFLPRRNLTGRQVNECSLLNMWVYYAP